MANPDGSVIIDTKINTDDVEDGQKEIETGFKKTADAVEACSEKISKVLEDSEKTTNEKLKSIAQIYEQSGVESTEAWRKAGEVIADSLAKAREETESTAPPVESLTDKISRQKRELDSLKKSYINTAHEFGSTSDEAIDLGKKIEDLSTELSENERAFKEASEAADNFDKTLEGLENPKDPTGGIGAMLKKSIAGVATVATLKEAAEAVVEFGKESVKLGSDLQEVQNVVDVTFTTMSDKVNEFAKSADTSAGLSETMAKEYAGTFGTMAKSMGFAESEAYELATALTQFTGDLASFRNLSQDEAFTKLQAIFTGETESLKALGVVMTQTNLDAFALANGFGKTTDAMTEQEKVSLRYQYVMDQLSAAQGDFVRTQDSWANQTKTLELQVENLKTTVGEGLIGALSGTVQFINESVLPALQNFADYFAEAFDTTPAEEFRNSMESFKNTMADANTELEESMADMLQTSYAVDAVVDSMTELEAAGLKTAESQRQYEAAVRTLNTLLPDLNAQIDKNTGLIDKNTQEIYENLKAMKEQVKYKVYQKMLEANEVALDDLATAYTNLYTAQFQQEGIEKQLQEAYGLTTEQIDKLKEAFIGMSDELGNNTQHTDRQRVALAAQRAGIANTTPEMKKLISALSDATVQEAELSVAIQEQETALEEVMPMLEQYKEEVLGIEDATKNAAESLGSMSGEISESAASGALSGTSDIVAGVMDELSMETDKTYSELTKGLENNAAVVEKHIENLSSLMVSGASDELIRQFANTNSETMAALNEAMQASNGQFTELIQNFEAYQRAVEDLDQTISAWEHTAAVTEAAAKQSIDEVWAEYQQQSVDWIESRASLINTESDKAKSDARTLVNEAEALADEANELFEKALEAREEGNYSQAARYQEMARQKQEEARKILQEAQALFDEASKLEGKVPQTAGIVADVAKKIEGQVGETTKSISQNISDVEQHLADTLGTSEGVISEMGDGIVDTVTGAADEVKDVISDAATTSGKKIQEAAQESTKISEQGAERIENIANSLLDDIMDQTVKDFTETVDKIQQMINGIEGKTVYVDVVSRQYPTTYTGSYATPIGIPYLAEGAVIPPNAPFMAVLGDQRHGTNLEAPADLIRQIVREEMEGAELGGDIHIEFGGDLAGLASILAPVITREQRRNSRAGGY